MTITKKNKNKSVFTKLKCSPKTKKKDYHKNKKYLESKTST
jgi:hypothetical protein